jgi:hypothetical protein
MNLIKDAIRSDNGQKFISAAKVAAAGGGDKANKAMTDPKLKQLMKLGTAFAKKDHIGAIRAGTNLVGAVETAGLYNDFRKGDHVSMIQRMGRVAAAAASRSKP